MTRAVSGFWAEATHFAKVVRWPVVFADSAAGSNATGVTVRTSGTAGWTRGPGVRWSPRKCRRVSRGSRPSSTMDMANGSRAASDFRLRMRSFRTSTVSGLATYSGEVVLVRSGKPSSRTSPEASRTTRFRQREVTSQLPKPMPPVAWRACSMSKTSR